MRQYLAETCMQCILDASQGQHLSLYTWRDNRLTSPLTVTLVREIIDTVRRQLGGIPAERTDHVIKVLVGQVIVPETFPTEGVSA